MLMMGVPLSAFGGSAGGSLSLSNTSIAENTVAGQTIGSLSTSQSGTWSYSLMASYNAGGRVAISGANLVTTSTAFDYETATSYPVRIRAVRTTPYAAYEVEFTINVTDVVEGAAPVNTVAPVITGNPGPNSTVDPLVVSTGTWSNTPTAYSYQWFINGNAESGQTSNTYSGTAAVGDVVTATVTATNSTGSNSANATGKTILAYMAAPTMSSTPLNYDGGQAGRGYRIDSPQGVTIGYLLGMTSGATATLHSSGSGKVQLNGSGDQIQIGASGGTATPNVAFPAIVKQVKAGFADTYTTFSIRPAAAVPSGLLNYQPRVAALGDSIFEFNSVVQSLSVTSDSASTAFSISITSGSTAATASTASHGYVVGDPITGTGIPAGTTIAAVSGTSLTLSAAATATNATLKPTLTLTTTSGSNVATVPFTCNVSLVGTSPILGVLPAGTYVVAQNGKSLTLSNNATGTGVQTAPTWRGIVKSFRTGIGGEVIAARARKPNFHFDSYMEPANVRTAGSTPAAFWGDNHGVASDSIVGAAARVVPAMARLPDILLVAIGINVSGPGSNGVTNAQSILALVDSIHTNYPSVRIILFGLRAVGTSQISGNSRGLQSIKDCNAYLAANATTGRSWLQYVFLPYNNNPASGTAGSQAYSAYDLGLAINYETITQTGDDIHPGGYGAEVIAGGPISDAIQANINSSVANVPITQGITSALSNERRYFAGADRALTTTNGVSGTATAEWNVSQAANASSIAVSTEANTEFVSNGKKLVCTVTFNGATAQTFDIRPVGTTLLISALSGKWVRAAFCLEVDSSQAWIQALLTMYPSGFLPNSTQNEIEIAGSIYGDGLGGSRTRWFLSDPFLMPAASTYLPAVTIRHLPTRVVAGSTGVVKLKYFDAFEVPDPRVSLGQ